MMRYSTNPVIILINNGGYAIEVEIHEGRPLQPDQQLGLHRTAG